MKNYKNYAPGFFMPPGENFDFVKKIRIEKAPIFCSVDLRDGNQALITPMSLEEKIEFFKLLVKIGFKEIEIGFPAASETEFEFARHLIEQNLIPDDVSIQVLTQAREHIIRKTFLALEGAKNAVVHLYNSTSVAQREQVFKKDKEQIRKIAVDGAKMLKEISAETKGNFMFEYSPESFTGTEPEFALDVVNSVLEVLKPTAQKKVIINLPVTVQMSSPHVYAAQIEYMSKNIQGRKNVIISLHPHNDRGCAVADCELGLLAGGDRIEGTLFGNGERTGNADIITVAMNMYSHGVDPGLDFSDMPQIAERYERFTKLPVHQRHPYAGELVFTAFSGSHQDAIAKGLEYRGANNPQFWTVPYLPIDPKDVGRNYDRDIIRINSQSGKGGVAFVLEKNYGFVLPKNMREEFGYTVKDISDKNHKELSNEEIYSAFKFEYLNICDPIEFLDYEQTKKDGKIHISLTCNFKGERAVYNGSGNGIFDAAVDALETAFSVSIKDLTYSEHALERGSKARAAAYVGAKVNSSDLTFGAGVDFDIIISSIKALISAINKCLKK